MLFGSRVKHSSTTLHAVGRSAVGSCIDSECLIAVVPQFLPSAHDPLFRVPCRCVLGQHHQDMDFSLNWGQAM